MKATGVVRRIDDLGRIVIPKEVRRTMRIKEGDSVEIFIEGADKVVLRKYSPVQNINEFIDEFVNSIFDATKKDIVVIDSEKVIAISKNIKKDIIGRRISLRMEDKLNHRNTQMVEKGNVLELTDNYSIKKPCLIKPIMVYGDIIGAIILITDDNITYVDKNLIEFSGTFFCKYLEG